MKVMECLGTSLIDVTTVHARLAAVLGDSDA